MIIGEKIFFDQQLNERQRHRAVVRARRGKTVKKYLLIVRIAGDQNLLEILTFREVKRLKERHKVMALAGVAKNRDGAFKVVEDMAIAVAKAHGAMTQETLDKELGIIWTLTKDI